MHGRECLDLNVFGFGEDRKACSANIGRYILGHLLYIGTEIEPQSVASFLLLPRILIFGCALVSTEWMLVQLLPDEM